GVHLALGRDPAHDREMIARLPLVHDRCLTLRAIRPDDPWQEVEARFVHEDQHPTLAAGLLPPERPPLPSPALRRLFIALEGPNDRDLRGPSQALEDAGDLASAVPDPEFLPEDDSDTVTRPDLARKAIGFRAVPEEVGDQAGLLGCEFGTGTQA